MNESISNATAAQNGQRETLVDELPLFPDLFHKVQDAEKSDGATYDNLLHHASGTVHNVKPAGNPSYNNDKGQMNPNDSKEQKTSRRKHGAPLKTDGKEPNWFKRWSKNQGGGGFGLGGMKLLGPGSIGGASMVPPNVSTNTAGGTSGSPMMLLLVLVGVAVIGYFLWHKLHKAHSEEHDIDRKEATESDT